MKHPKIEISKERQALVDLWLECNENIGQAKLQLDHWSKTRNELERALNNIT